MALSLSQFAQGLNVETAFNVLAIAKSLKAKGKDVIELEIGDSPFPSTASAKAAGIAAIQNNQTHYGPSPGLPEFRRSAAEFVRREFAIPAAPEQIVVAPGAKVFEQYFCEAFLEPGDGVLVFSPHFPTYPPNIARRGARVVAASLSESRQFRPDPRDVAHFLQTDPSPKAIFFNSPHNPTGGVMTAADWQEIADVVDGHDVAIFSDEPYCHMVWQGTHASPLAEPRLFDKMVGVYTFSKSYSMSGWRLGFAVAPPLIADAFSKMINTTLSCAPPMVQAAGIAALEHDSAERNAQMADFAQKVKLLAEGLATLPEITCAVPAGTFYVFPNISRICHRFQMTSHGLALYLLQGASDRRGVACLGGECFGQAGLGYLRLSCAEPDERLRQAVDFIGEAFQNTDRVAAWLRDHPEYKWDVPPR